MTELQEVRGLTEIDAGTDSAVPLHRHRPVVLLVTFLLGVFCTVAVTIGFLSVFNIHGTISWPAGRIDIGQNVAPHVVHDAH
jgi:hypothetical protein